MYDRYTICASKEQVQQVLQIKVDRHEPNYNAHPSQQLPVIACLHPQKALLYHWGLMTQISNNKSLSPKLFNLPIQQALNKPYHRKMLHSNRCIIIADGFYAWKKVSKKQRVPYYFYLDNRQLFGIAGITEESEDIEGNTIQSFMMILQDASPEVQYFQDDMPAILKKDSFDQWLGTDLETDAIQSFFLKGLPKLKCHAVSPMIENATLNNERLIAPSAPSDQFGNYTLFT